MLLDIFSRFDDHNKAFINLHFLSWILIVLPLLLINQLYVKKTESISSRVARVTKDLTFRTKINNIGGSLTVIIRVAFFLLIINTTGLIPFSFSLRSHLVINLAISSVVWVSIVVARISFNSKEFLAHLLPANSPAALTPFLCLIELVRLLVRPLTLRVRLTANLRTGHILITLLGRAYRASSLIRGNLIILLGIFYFMFEIGVCFIQAYIFTLLPTLYSDEHPN